MARYLSANGAANDILVAAGLGDLRQFRRMWVGFYKRPSLRNQRSRTGNTPLHMAAANGHTKVVKFLLEAGADINFKAYYDTEANDMTPLHKAARHGHAEVVRLLLDAGANAKALTSYGRTPLSMAETAGHADVVELLRRHTERQQ